MAHLFKIGDRVRIDCPISCDHGKETTVRSLGVEVASDYEGGPYTGIEVDIECDCQDDGIWGCVFEPHELIPIQRRGDKLEAFDTTATDEATKAMLKAMSEKGVACV